MRKKIHHSSKNQESEQDKVSCWTKIILEIFLKTLKNGNGEHEKRKKGASCDLNYKR